MNNITTKRPSIKSSKNEPENQPLLYVPVPREWLWRPVIADSDGLTPFVFAIACAVLNLAHKDLRELRHEEAWAAGGAEINVLEEDEKYDAKQTGALAYAERKKLKPRPPKILTVKTTKRALLAAVRLGDNGRYKKQITAALERLTQPLADNIRPPLLRSFREKPLTLEISGVWLKPPYVRLPLPLLLHSRSGLALFLWLQTINTGWTNKQKGIDAAKLCRIVGIGDKWKKRDLDRAVDAVNHYLRYQVADADARILAGDKYELHIAECYKVDRSDNFIRFRFEPRLDRWQKEDKERKRQQQRQDERDAAEVARREQWERQQEAKQMRDRQRQPSALVQAVTRLYERRQ